MQYAELSQEEKDRLRCAYEEGFSAGSGKPSLVPDELIDLMVAVADDWFLALETMQAQRLRVWLRAYAERGALEQERPHDWIKSVAEEGRT